MTPRLMLTLGVALVALVVAFVFATERRRGGEVVTAVLPRGDGVREGATVTYLGVPFGFIERLRIHEGRVVVSIRIHRSDVQLRAADTLHLRTLGLLGDRILDVAPGPLTAALVGPGDTLFATRPPEIPEGLLDTLARIIRR